MLSIQQNMNSKELEKEVQEILKSDEWQILANSYYTDPNSNKPREKDIIAKKNLENYDLILFFECKLISEETEIFSKGKVKELKKSLITHAIPHADIPEIEDNRATHFYKYVDYFESKDSRDYFFKAINQNLQSFSAYRKNNQRASVCYLIVVYSGYVFQKIDSMRQQCDNALIKIETMDDTFNLPNNECLIEIVEITKLKNLLHEIKNDVNRINQSAILYRRMGQNRIYKNRQARIDDSDYGLL